MSKEIKAYNDKQTSDDKEICDRLATIIENGMSEAESKINNNKTLAYLSV